jgi:ribonuclease HII
MAPHFDLEREFFARGLGPVAGIDEVGRGPLAGPVCAAVVILDPDNLPDGLDDSKKLSAKRREALEAEIYARALAVAVALSPAEEIDRVNIREATLLSMRRAALALSVTPGAVLVDGNDPPALPWPTRAVVKGDATSLSIAAASIIAKCARDRLMKRLDGIYPGYGFGRDAGYPTAAHRAALLELGPCPEHRRSFKPLRLLLDARPDWSR